MPSFIGSVSINNVGGGAIVEFGDTGFISPKSSTKSNQGSGSANTGAIVVNINVISSSEQEQADLIDQPMSGNL
ncbi:spore germination protein [Neobacillus sp. NPDC097160]|uniref:spore germination protein n=1 Tax=Neobacillus sp. NPDC097160 TaxID=3364298 RepID=UPI00381718AA